MHFSMTANGKYAVAQRRLTKPALPIGWLWSILFASKTDNLSSKLPTQTHQLHYPASRTSFPDTITSCRKTAVVLKLSNATSAEFFTSTAKIQCGYAHLMTELQLMALIENIPLNVKNRRRCVKNCSFFVILAMAISGMPTPEICYSPGQLKRTIFP